MSRESTGTESGWTGLDQRGFVALLGSGIVVGVAGCGGDGDTTTATLTPTPTGTTGELPEEYRTATAIGGKRRDHGALSVKSAVN